MDMRVHYLLSKVFCWFSRRSGTGTWGFLYYGGGKCMKVALFTDTYLPQINGVTGTITRLIQYYDSKGIEYKIICPHYYDTCQKER